MTPCIYCDNKKTVYKCSKCRAEVCEEHLISTEYYYCKKHDSVEYSHVKADIFDDRCKVLEKSSCPQCKALLMLDIMPNKEYYLKCTKCSWDSYKLNPKIHHKNYKLVIKEGISNKLIKKADLCNRKLKRKKGINICPNCLVQFLKNGHITSFSTVRN
ncbi:MAG: hypothetical protein GF364_21750, partial [Candidatus Lokiarchaeota archaeon]|nr:hypothetical protein [Candidatus Lokiarchaeota archaeon]